MTGINTDCHFTGGGNYIFSVPGVVIAVPEMTNIMSLLMRIEQKK